MEQPCGFVYHPRVLRTFLYALTPLLEPIGFLWLALLLAAAVCLKRRRFKAAGFAGLAALFLTIIGSTSLPGILLNTLERPYLIKDLAAVPTADAVVIMGGGMRPSRYEVKGVGLNEAADRLILGVELMRQGKADNLVLGGALRKVGDKYVSEPEVVRQWFVEWGLVTQPMYTLADCNNTHDEALRTAALVKERGWKKVLLVTSASHMRRAEAVFQTAGVPVVGVACDYQTRMSGKSEEPFNPIPRISGFLQTSLYLHEQIGWVTYRYRGWIKN